MKKQYKITITLCMLQFCLSAFAFAQTTPVFHVDPNKAAQLLPGDYQDVPVNPDFNNKIVIWNGYKKTVTYLLSLDKVRWDTVKLTGPDYKLYSSTNLFLKIYTTSTVFNYYQITSASVYSIMFDKDKKVWTLK